MSTMTAGLGSSVDHQRVWDLGFELLELAGSGSWSDIWRIRRRDTGAVFAWQQLRTEWEEHPAARADIENEVAVGRLVRSPRLPRLVESHITERPIYVIWEWFDARSLDDLLREYPQFSVRSALWIIRQCAEGLDDLLQAGLTHGDLNARHIMVETRTGAVKLSHLGGSRRVRHHDPLHGRRQAQFAGPLDDYESVVAPQHLQGIERDMYCLGALLFRALTGRMPHEAETAADLLRGPQLDIAEDLRRLRSDIEPALANLVADLASANSPLLSQPWEIVNRLMEFEVQELARLDPRRAG